MNWQTAVDLYNYFETALWTVGAIAALVWAVKAPPGRRRHFVIGAILLLLMAASEAIESQTGAWWRPLALSGVKGHLHRRGHRHRRSLSS